FPAGVADEQHRVPRLSFLSDQGSSAVAGVDQFSPVLVEDLACPPSVLRVGGSAFWGEAQQVEHDNRAAGILVEEAGKVRARGVNCHGEGSFAVRMKGGWPSGEGSSPTTMTYRMVGMYGCWGGWVLSGSKEQPPLPAEGSHA